VTTLTKFSISFAGSRSKIEALAGRASLTATILQAIADTVKENAHDFDLKREEFWKTWTKVLEACKDNYETLEKAVKRAKGKDKSGKGREVWDRLCWALGGEDQMKELEDGLEKSCEQVMMMHQVVQMSAIRLVAQR